MRRRRLSLAFLAGLASAVLSMPASAGPPANQIVESHGHKIAYQVYPGRQPAIVLDAGGGNDSTYWASLIPELSKATGSEIITYDRSGFGGSEEAPGPWNVMTARDDLVAVLKANHATRKVVLASHSLAGEIALYATQAHPDWFTGVVMVDANIPQFYTEPGIKAAAASYAPVIAQLKAAPPTPSGRQLLALSASFEETSRAFHKARWPTAVPVLVIVSEATPMEDAFLANLWRNSHAEFAKGAPNRTLITAAHSSHDVAHDRPDIVTKAVQDLVAKARQKPCRPPSRLATCAASRQRNRLG
ncbi:MAG TPA: alpha/beta hydrolase [Phenylobacterium sp.]